MNDQIELTERERRLLEEVEKLVAGGSSATREDGSLFGFCANLASTIPSADPEFKQRIGAQLMAWWNERRAAVEKTTTFRDQRGMRFTSLTQRLEAGVDELQENLKKLGGMTMKKRLVFFSVAMLIVAILTVAFVPPVQAVVVEAIKRVVLSPYADVVQITAPGKDTVKPEPRDIGWLIKTDIGNFGGDVSPGSDPSVRLVRSFEEAQSLTGFHLLTPAYLPEGYRLREVKIAPFNDWTLLFYNGPGHDIIIVQMPVGSLPGDDPNVLRSVASGVMTDGSVEEVDFDGQKAAWVEGHTLVWESNGITYEVGGLDLDLQQAMEIARSLG